MRLDFWPRGHILTVLMIWWHLYQNAKNSHENYWADLKRPRKTRKIPMKPDVLHKSQSSSVTSKAHKLKNLQSHDLKCIWQKSILHLNWRYISCARYLLRKLRMFTFEICSWEFRKNQNINKINLIVKRTKTKWIELKTFIFQLK